jgi:arsenite methyltransferase
MGLSCGNPQAIADLKPGEIVVDLGSGGGFDCFLAAPKVEKEGQVIGIDMTPEMISKARRNTEKPGFENVEIRLSEIEHMLVADHTADIIITNCVINLSPNKQQVFKEAYRILKTGGRLAISDVVLTTTLPESYLSDMNLYSGCVSGAVLIEK